MVARFGSTPVFHLQFGKADHAPFIQCTRGFHSMRNQAFGHRYSISGWRRCDSRAIPLLDSSSSSPDGTQQQHLGQLLLSLLCSGCQDITNHTPTMGCKHQLMWASGTYNLRGFRVVEFSGLTRKFLGGFRFFVYGDNHFDRLQTVQTFGNSALIVLTKECLPCGASEHSTAQHSRKEPSNPVGI